jgi:hypothetical protein
MAKYRFRVEHDPDYLPETPQGGDLPGTAEDYAETPIMVLVDPQADPQTGERRELSYKEYCRSYGDPEQHRVLADDLERQCEHCGHWDHVSSLHGIDCMIDDDELNDEGKVVETPEQLTGCLAEVARELLEGAQDVLEEPSAS